MKFADPNRAVEIKAQAREMERHQRPARLLVVWHNSARAVMTPAEVDAVNQLHGTFAPLGKTWEWALEFWLTGRGD